MEELHSLTDSRQLLLRTNRLKQWLCKQEVILPASRCNVQFNW